MNEYLYLTKGYHDNISKGQDVKNGYAVNKIGKTNSLIKIDNKNVVRRIDVFECIRTTDSSKVALLVQFSRHDTNYNTYVCIPDKNSTPELSKKAEQDFYKITSNLDEKTAVGYHYLWNSLNLLRDFYFYCKE